MLGSTRQSKLARSVPFYYGWVVFGVSASTSYSSRPLMAVATLSVFLLPMTDDLGWSRGLFSGAVSLGGICAVVISPLVGWSVDRYGSSAVVAAGGALAGACAVGLSQIAQSWAFYLLYVPGRMAFASPLELGTSTAVTNWFIRRRAFVLGLLNVTQGMGLALMPLAAFAIISGWNWRTAWASLGIYTLSVSVVPALLLLARRPEDLGLEPDPRAGDPGAGRTEALSTESKGEGNDGGTGYLVEPRYTLRQALNTRAFWILAGFAGAGYMVQAGVSLHQYSHYVQQGLSGSNAAIVVSVFAISQVPGGLFWAFAAQRVPVRLLLSFSGICLAVGAAGTTFTGSFVGGVASASALGVGVGGLHVLLRLAWADYYGRHYLGSICGVTLPVQLAGQAMGPVIAGFIYDARGSYDVPFLLFAGAVCVGAVTVLGAKPPSDGTPSPAGA